MRNIAYLLCFSAMAFLAPAALPAQKGDEGLGRAASAEELVRIDATVMPAGRGLPEGHGTASEGEALYVSKCQGCHGPDGSGNLPQGPALVGGIGSLATDNPIKTVGSYWPYATTVWDYIRRAMPLNRPGSLSANETYAVTAFLLNRNKLIGADQEMNRNTLPQLPMPNRDGFIPDGRPDIESRSAAKSANKPKKHGPAHP